MNISYDLEQQFSQVRKTQPRITPDIWVMFIIFVSENQGMKKQKHLLKQIKKLNNWVTKQNFRVTNPSKLSQLDAASSWASPFQGILKAFSMR